MRRALALAGILALTLSGVAQAAPPVGMLVGHVTFYVASGAARVVTVHARGTDPAVGRWVRTVAETRTLGTVTCLIVDGSDAWMAGPVTGSADGATFAWFHDGGSPGSAGDTAFQYISDEGETLADMEDYCEAKTTDLTVFGLDAPFDVAGGNLVVSPAE